MWLSQPKYPWFFPNFQARYICRLAAEVLMTAKARAKIPNTRPDAA